MVLFNTKRNRRRVRRNSFQSVAPFPLSYLQHFPPSFLPFLPLHFLLLCFPLFLSPFPPSFSTCVFLSFFSLFVPSLSRCPKKSSRAIGSKMDTIKPSSDTSFEDQHALHESITSTSSCRILSSSSYPWIPQLRRRGKLMTVRWPRRSDAPPKLAAITITKDVRLARGETEP